MVRCFTLRTIIDSLTPHLTQGTANKELDSLISFEPRTKEDFQEFSRRIIEYIVKRHESKPLYAAFVEHHVRELAAPLKDVEVRKAASGLTTLANEKQKEQRDKASGKKKTKAAAKPTLGSAKASTKWVFPHGCSNVADCNSIDTIRPHIMSHWMTLGTIQMISCSFIPSVLPSAQSLPFAIGSTCSCA